ncbi:MAG TPA: polysaccharide deacetylase family protein [Candidatus Acidoferrum sp.]|nr:polysaccharide deacetylase family protein [Candidatus Acidoferrum sp.]
MSQPTFRIAILTGQDSPATCLAVERLLAIPGVEVCGILLDTAQPGLRRKLMNLRRSVRREGLSYLWFRAGEAVSELVEKWADNIVPRNEVKKLIRQAFPERPLELSDFESLRGIKLIHAGNLNSPESAQILKDLRADLGVVIGTRILKASTFSVPRLGSLNIHKGKVPEYRGQPAGFWEIFDGREESAVTVHFVDDGLDTGDILGDRSVPIHPKDSPATLRSKLDLAGADLLAECVKQIAAGTAVRRPQPKSNYKPRTSPTRKQRIKVENRLGLGKAEQRRWRRTAKTLLYLGIYRLGIYRLARAIHQRVPGGRSCILLYHRVNDQALDSLTCSAQRFAEHLVAVSRDYRVVPTTQLVNRVKHPDPERGSSVAIHFDDCYRDIFQNASRLLAQAKAPACSFISTGFIDTDRIFPHDIETCPFHLQNLTAADIVALQRSGFEIGAHTVNHVDLGKVGLDLAHTEITESRKSLEAILGRPVNYVSFPYGKKTNIRPEVTELVRETGYEAMFSAYGGYVTRGADLFNIQRVGVSGQYRALDLLLTIEGLTFETLKQRWKA